MNKSKVKFLEQCAELLPEITEKRVTYPLMVGKDVAGHLETDEAGKPINNKKSYRVKRVETVPVDHLKKLKAVYNTGGMPAVKQYTEAVQALYEASKNEKPAEKPVPQSL